MTDSGDTGATAPPQLSPDGHWWWTGTEWIPANQAPPAEPEVAAAPEPEPDPAPRADPIAAAAPVAETAWRSPTPSMEPAMDQTFSPAAAAPAGPGGWPPSPQQTGWPTPQPGWPAQPGGWAPQGPVGPSRTSGLAIAALVVAFIPVIGSLPAIVLGVIALAKISSSNGALRGRGLAIAGIVLGSLTVVVGILAAIAIPTFLNQRLKAYDADTKSVLKNAATAEESYYSDNSVYTDSVSELAAEGFDDDPDVTVVVALAPDGSEYCIQGTHRGIGEARDDYRDHVWYIGSRTGTVSTDPEVACA